jgi:hypothetical protein
MFSEGEEAISSRSFGTMAMGYVCFTRGSTVDGSHGRKRQVEQYR